jgi:dihydrofolate reductase
MLEQAPTGEVSISSVPVRIENQRRQNMRITATIGLTLDGVMQAPARPDEDERDGFRHGGWAIPFQDAVLAEAMAKRMTLKGALLLGRVTYQDLYSVWPHRKDNPYTDRLNNSQKYVASRTLSEPLPWQNSTLLKGDAADAVAALKKEGGPDLGILGSGELVRALSRRNLIDEYVLTIFPLVLGSGRRLFEQDGYAQLRLVEATTTTTGVILAIYRPAP